MPRKIPLDPKLKEILANIHPIEGDDDWLAEPVEDAAQRLRTLYQRLTNGREQSLRPGQLAIWKPGLKNRRFPAYGQPVIVVAVLEAPIIDHEDDAGVTYFREPLDLLLGILHPDGSFLIYHFDSHRFQSCEDEGAASG